MALMERKRRKDKKPSGDVPPEAREGHAPADAIETTPGQDTSSASDESITSASHVPAAIDLAPVSLASATATPVASPRTLVEIAASTTTQAGEDHDHEQEMELEHLPEMHRDVLGVARDSLKKKRYEADVSFEPYTPMVEKLLGDCLARFHAQKGYTRDGILDTIKELEAKRWIITGERRTREEILESELHQSIMTFIEKYPGVHARDERVQEELGITRNPFLKHLLVLERFELVKKRQHGKLWNYYSPSFPDDDVLAELVVLLYNDVARQLISLLLHDPASTIVDLARRVIPPVYHGAIQYHLKKFEDIGFVSVDGDRRVVNATLLASYNDVVPRDLRIS